MLKRGCQATHVLEHIHVLVLLAIRQHRHVVYFNIAELDNTGLVQMYMYCMSNEYWNISLSGTCSMLFSQVQCCICI